MERLMYLRQMRPQYSMDVWKKQSPLDRLPGSVRATKIRPSRGWMYEALWPLAKGYKIRVWTGSKGNGSTRCEVRSR